MTGAERRWRRLAALGWMVDVRLVTASVEDNPHSGEWSVSVSEHLYAGDHHGAHHRRLSRALAIVERQVGGVPVRQWTAVSPLDALS